MLNKRLLRQFIAVAEELHFGKAALRVGIAQSPLSQAIQKLEAYVGAPLFVRTKRSVALTAAGRVFLGEAYQWLKHEDAVIARTLSANAGTTGRLLVGFIGSAGYGFMPELVSRFRSAYPQVRLRLIEMNTKDQVEHLKSGYLDAGLLRLPLPGGTEELETRPYKRDQLMAALHRDHPLAGEASIDLLELANEPFVAFSREKIPAAHAQLISACVDAGFYPEIDQECTQIASVICLVAAGVAVALVSGNLTALIHSNVRYVPLRNESRFLAQHVAIAWRKGDENPALISLRDVAAQLAD
jgi:DNA-binding transcriptional LysR family regulator